MRHHDVACTTHTPELDQIHEINEHLSTCPAGSPVRAAELGLTGTQAEMVHVPHNHVNQNTDNDSAATSVDPIDELSEQTAVLPDTAELDHLAAYGPPDFPYIRGHFRQSGESGTDDPLLAVPLHTDALRQLSHHFGLRHTWGS